MMQRGHSQAVMSMKLFFQMFFAPLVTTMYAMLGAGLTAEQLSCSRQSSAGCSVMQAVAVAGGG